MVEITGTIERMEKANISGVDLLVFKSEDGKTQINLELTSKINPFKELDPVKMVFDTKQIDSPDTQKLILNAYIYSITKESEINTIVITCGGLQIKIKTPNDYDLFKTKKDLNIQFL